MVDALDKFAKRSSFLQMNQADQMRALGWYLHTELGKDRVVTSDFRECFQKLHLDPPNISRYLSYLSEGRNRAFIRDRKGFRLEGKTRAALSNKFAEEAETVTVRQILSDVVASISDQEQRIFAEEALQCFSVKAFRATIVMTWNLAYDHLCRWIHADEDRLEKFNNSHSTKFPKSKLVFAKFSDFSEEKEFNVIETAAHAKLLTKNRAEILKEKLKRRNAAAHPSDVTISQSQAEDVITDLINNIVHKLT